MDALLSKYIEGLRESKNPETITLGSSNGVIQVEAVNLDKVRRKLAQLDHLQLVSLDSEDTVDVGSTEELRARIPNVRDLDLSRNLFTKWATVESCATQLVLLESLCLNGNRFATPMRTGLDKTPFTALRRLYLNSTFILWPDLLQLLPSMPYLNQLEAGYNHIADLQATTSVQHPELRQLNLDTNLLSSWENICAGLTLFPALERVVLNSNQLSEICQLQDGRPLQIKHLVLSENLLTTWSSIDNLQSWCPCLESLNISGNPVLQEPTSKAHTRQITIARLASLNSLNSTAITPAERRDAERFYLSFIMKQHQQSDGDRLREHPRWLKLCEQHGRPDVEQRSGHQDSLSDRLLSIKIVVINESPPSKEASKEKREVAAKLLPTMKVSALRMKLLRALDLPRSTRIKAWVELDGDKGSYFAPIDFTRTTDDLQFVGMEQACTILTFVDE